MTILKSIVRITEATYPTSTNYLSYDECIDICNKCVAASTKSNVLMNIAITDHTGNLLFFYKMLGAWEGSVQIAQAKAYTAFAFSGDKDKQGPLTTEELGKLSQPGQPLFGIQNTNIDKSIVVFGGGVPLYRQNKLVGALGISGSSVDNDIKICNIGAKAFS